MRTTPEHERKARRCCAICLSFFVCITVLLDGCATAGLSPRQASQTAADPIHSSPMALIRYAHEACVRTDLTSLLKCVEPLLAPSVKAMFEALRECRDLEKENVLLAKRRFAAEIKAQFGPDAFDPSDWVGHGHWWAVWCGLTPFPHSLPITAKKLAQPVQKADWNMVKVAESGDKAVVMVKERQVFCDDWAVRRIGGAWYFGFTDADKMRKGWVDQAEEFMKYAAFLKHMNQAVRSGKIRSYREYDEETMRYKEAFQVKM